MSNLKVKNAEGTTQYRKAVGTGTDAAPFITYSSTIGDASIVAPSLFQFADEVGDGSGNTNMNVDGSTTPVVFKVAPPAGYIYRVARIIVSVRDTGSFDSGGWGNNGGSPLPNGITASVVLDGTEVSFTAEPVKSHIDLAALSYDVSHNNWGSGDEFIVFRFTFTKSGNYIALNGDTNDELRFYINDDLEYLVQQRVSVQGKTSLVST